MKKALLLVLSFVLAPGLAAPIATPGAAGVVQWDRQIVDPEEDIFADTSIALDSSGNPHISYYDSFNHDLKYARWTGSTWRLQTVDSTDDVGLYSSLALDAAGNPHISYYDTSHLNLKYANWTGVAWSIQTVDSGPGVGASSSLALDGSGTPHIAYYDGGLNQDLKYARWTGSAWSIQTVDSDGDVGGFCSLALDAGGRPHISYSDSSNYDLKYTQWTGSGWSIQTVDSAGRVGEDSAIALDANGHARISYMQMNVYPDRDLKYAEWTGSGWTVQTVDAAGEVGDYSSVAVDSSDAAHISYYDATNHTVKHAQLAGAVWALETVSGANTYGKTSIALDASDSPHISCTDSQAFGSALLHASWTGSAWERQVVDGPPKGRGSSLALDADDQPHTSYYAHSSVMYAWRDGSAWNVEVVDSAGGTGAGTTGATSLALDSDGRPHIVYLNDLSGNLKYAHWTGSTWKIETVESEATTSGNPSLALDSDGHPHISYWCFRPAQGPGSLKYAQWTGSEWHVQIVTPSNGGWPSLALDSGDNPHISYSGNAGVTYAHWTGTGWDQQVINSGAYGWSSLAIDSNDHPHVCYREYEPAPQYRYFLKYARWTGSTWEIQSVDQAYGGGSLALDSSDEPYMAYDGGAGLELAQRNGSAWDITVVHGGGSPSVVGEEPSIALDSSGLPHISYRVRSMYYLGGSLNYAAASARDDWPPAITITSPADGAEYLLNQVVNAVWSVTDDQSGVDPATVIATTAHGAPIDTGTAGSHSFAVSAKDFAGNMASKTVTYAVQYGFLAREGPHAAPAGSYKAGSSVPLQWQYLNAAGQVINSAAASPRVFIRLGSTVVPAEDAGRSGYRYDPLTMTWQFNWKTKGLAAGTYEVQIRSQQSGQTDVLQVVLR